MSPAARAVRRTVVLLWSATAVLALAVALTPLEITPSTLRTAVFAVALAGFPFAVGRLAARALWDTRRDRIRATVATALALAVVLVPLSQSLTFWLAISPWQTTGVRYRHRDDHRLMIAQQMRDIGAFGYDRRLERTYELAPLLRWDAAQLDAEPSATQPDPGLEWVRADESRNPFGWQ